MAARARKHSESFGQYRKALKDEARKLNEYLNGQMVYVSGVVFEVPNPVNPMEKIKRVKTNPPAIRINRLQVDITKIPFDRYYKPMRA